MMAATEVLIVGAGPTGLVLALSLGRFGIRIRIVDKAVGPGTTSRALVVHARTLEFYRQLGIADAAIGRGLKFAALNLWSGGRRAARVPFGDLGAGLSPYPYALIFPQDQHEALLIEALERQGVGVERQTELVSFDRDGDGVEARLKGPDGTTRSCRARWLAGCDGARSAVREGLGIGFPGGTYSGLFYVADIAGRGPPVDGELHVALDEADFLAVFPMRGQGRVRLVGNVLREPAEEEHFGWDDVGKRVVGELGLGVDEIRWFSTYRVHHRVAQTFRRGPVFLLGDAAHIHSPVGGQGMNTGIGDAFNLAWKLAAVLRDRLSPAALDSFGQERMAFARKLVATTDRAFEFVSSRGPIARRVRLDVVPFVLPRLFRFAPARRLMFRTVSQIAIRYPASRLSTGGAGGLRAGDRLPWVELGSDGTDNHVPLQCLDWQVHCYGWASDELRVFCRERALKLEGFAWQPSMRRAGFKKNAAYLVRPDGHIGWAGPTDDVAGLRGYLEGRGIVTVGAAGRGSSLRAAS